MPVTHRSNTQARTKSPLRGVSITPQRVCLWSAGLVLILCAVGGGSSRADSASLLYLRPLLMLIGGLLLALPLGLDWRQLRPVHWFLLALAVIIAAQLLPIPASLWLAVPGRAQFGEALAGGSGWHPLSLSPDSTWSSLFALLPSAVILVAIAGLGERDSRALLSALVALVLASAILGIAQLSAGPSSGLYFYSISHNEYPVGFLANRNHQAALLAMGLPIVRLWSIEPRATQTALIRTLAPLAYLFLIAVLLATGSRAGLVAAGLGLIGALFVSPPKWRALWNGSRRNRLLLTGSFMLGAVFLASMAVLGRAESFDRAFGGQDYRDELRIQNFPSLLEVLRDHWLFGTGFGSFDPVFRAYEPDKSLGPAYFNHAHNDYVELAMTGGLPALLLLLVFGVWLARQGLRALREPTDRGRVRFARLGLTIWAILGVASVPDYPLRVPLMMAVATIALVWIAQLRGPSQDSPDGKAA